MKELKVLLGVYLLFIVLLIACTKVASTPTIELGEKATATKIIVYTLLLQQER